MMGVWQEMNFREPLWLWLMLQPLLFYILARFVHHWRDTDYCETKLLPWVRVSSQTGKPARYLRTLLWFLAWILLAIAMAGPRLPETVADHSSTTQRELMVLLDMSPSMTARDITPNRLQRARLELLDLVTRMQDTRMGIIVYGARAHLLSPMTRDKNVLRHYINAISDKQLPTLGSRPGQAIKLAMQHLERHNNKARAILLITDGENHFDAAQQGQFNAVLNELVQKNIRLYALGTGTGYGAPVMDEEQGWLQYDGQAVNSKLDSGWLQHITQITKGRYSELRDNHSDWQQLYDEGIGRLKPVDQQLTSEKTTWHEHYHGFLIAGLLCLLLSLLQPRLIIRPHQLVILFTLITSSYINNDAQADDGYRTAYQQLNNGHYEQARKAFQQLPGYAARLGEGNAAYQLKDYRAASQQFTQALLDAVTDQQRGYALFNLANTRYQLTDYVTAARFYEDVLRYLPTHQGARTNLEYAKALQVQERRSDRTAHRAGRGPQTGSAPEGMSTEGVRGITLGDDDREKQFSIPNPVSKTENISENKIPGSKTASSKIDSNSDGEWYYRISSLQQLEQENPRIESDMGIFWKRLYEQEEGFVAPEEKAYRLPGVKPW